MTIDIHKRLFVPVLAGLLAAGCATSEIGEAPGSLRGTVPDGTLRADPAGNFVADDDAVRFFDYFLTAEGEMPASSLQALVIDEIERRLSGDAAAQAADAFIRYSEYREEAENVARSGDPAAVVAELHRLHAAYVADFPGLADEPARFERALALHRTLSDRGLDQAERAAAAARIDAELTPRHATLAMARTGERSRTHLRLRAAEAELAGAGASSAELTALREREVGAAAAARLAELDAERTRWQRRVRDYRAERDAVMAGIPTAAGRATALAELRDRHFAGRERARVEALDRLEASARLR